MNENTNNYKQFQELLRTGIGSRSQMEFAKAAGISRGNLNRMLNAEDAARPTIPMLKKLANQMPFVTLDELLLSCGYAPLSIDDEIKNNFNFLKEGLMHFTRKERFVPSLTEMFSTIQLLYIENNAKFTIIETKDNDKEVVFPEADKYSLISEQWKLGDIVCCTYFVLFYSQTLRGKHVIIDFIDDIDIINNLKLFENATSILLESKDFRKNYMTTVKQLSRNTKPSAEANLLRHILSIDGTYQNTTIGSGFYYKKTPCEFLDFLMENANYFCHTKENKELFQRAIKGNVPMDELFKDFMDSLSGSTGTGAVVSFILRNKTGHSFMYMEQEQDELDDDCIICPFEDAELGAKEIPSDLLKATYEAAKELGIPSFGMTYHVSVGYRHDDQVYNTSNFHYKL